MNQRSRNLAPIVLVAAVGLAGCARTATDAGGAASLTDAQVEDLVRRSYPYVAVFNVIQKAALDESNPMNTGGLNRLNAQTKLLDHNARAIARPNNDSLYITCMMDLRKDPVVLDCPGFGWRQEYGGLQIDQAKRLKELEKENDRLKKLLAESQLDNSILKEAAEGNFQAPSVAGAQRRMPHSGQRLQNRRVQDRNRQWESAPVSTRVSLRM